MKRIVFASLLVAAAALSASALRLEPINFGNMDQWITRNIKESAVIGGNNKVVYAIGPTATDNSGNAFRARGGCPWATSNVLAKVSGVTKGSNAVFPEAHGSGKCAKLCTILEHVKALGIINMDVLVSGSIFLGRMDEPIRNSSSPYSKMEMGIPFTKRPSYLVFDYKVTVPKGDRIQSSGIGSKKTIKGQDYAEVYILLQKRWEDEKGNIHALRVGTGRERYGSTVANWQTGHKIAVHYGDITKQPFYKSYMGLIPKSKAYYARNSKGKMVPVIEEGWAKADETPTHVLVMASAGCGTAFVGTPGMILWVDNFAFGYDK